MDYEFLELLSTNKCLKNVHLSTIFKNDYFFQYLTDFLSITVEKISIISDSIKLDALDYFYIPGPGTKV